MAADILDALMIGVTLAGSEVFLAAVVLAAYWCWDRRAGTTLVVAFLASMWLNSVLKLVFRLPRPPMEPVGRVVSCVRGLLGAEGYGFPSGHTQGTATVWWTLAGLTRSRAVAAAAAAATVLVGLSRVYLRAHYPADVIGGAALGLAVASAASAAWATARRRGAGQGRRRAAVGVSPAAAPPRAGVVGVVGVIGPVAAAVAVSLLMLAGPVDEPVVKSSGFFLGFAVGAALEPALCPFGRGGGARTRAARLALGLSCVLAAGGVLMAVSPPGLPWTWARYAVMGVSSTVIAPRAFIFAGLAEAEAGGA